MASFNKIMIVGYLGRDPEMRYTPQGTAVCNLSIATTEKRKGRSGESEDVTTWFRCSAFGRQAELANQWLKKGAQAAIEGRLRMESYTDKDGNQRQSLEVTVSEIHFLGSKDGTQASSASSGFAEGEHSAPTHAGPNPRNPAHAAATELQAPGGKTAETRPTKTQAELEAEENDIPF